ncbi:MAG: hypothetical protein KDA87_22395, partial [Planctomycetales bacterium]|nr:hypothetical protein [Planctomycetales bacterium]
SGDFVHVFQIGSYQRDIVAAAVLAKSDLVTAADFDHAPKRNKNPRQTASVRLPMPATPFVS